MYTNNPHRLLVCATVFASLSLLPGCAATTKSSAPEPPRVMSGENFNDSSQLTYPVFASTEQLVEASDAIVRGRLVSQRHDELRPLPPKTDNPAIDPQAGMSAEEIAKLPGMPITVFTMDVSEVLAGDAPQETLEVFEVDGIVDGASIGSSDDTLSVNPNQEYVLVMVEQENGRYDLPNPQQSAYIAGPEGIIEPVDESNGLEVKTSEELVAFMTNEEELIS